jgi:hypothetical protein
MPPRIRALLYFSAGCAPDTSLHWLRQFQSGCQETCVFRDFEAVCALRSGDAHRPVIVAVPIMWMMEVRPDGVIEVIAVRNTLMPAVRSVDMPAGMLDAFVRRRARRRIGRSNRHTMLIYVIPMNVMEMTIMDVVRVTFVLDGPVSAALAVRVTVLGMCLACHIAPPPHP